MDIMIDTNIIISAAVFPNPRMNQFLKTISEEHNLYICSISLEEVERVIKRKFPDRLGTMEMFLRKLSYTLIHTPTVDVMDINIRDKDDYPILISAIVGDVDVLISGDKDFADVDIERPEIMKISEFVAKYL